MSVTLKNPSQTLLALFQKKVFRKESLIMYIFKRTEYCKYFVFFQENDEEKEYEHIFTTARPTPILPSKIPTAADEFFLAHNPTELARQLTLIEYRLYSAIKPSECVGQNWMSKRKEELAPNILAMIHRFNFVSTWLSSEIVKCPDLQKRTQILKHVLDVAEV